MQTETGKTTAMDHHSTDCYADAYQVFKIDDGEDHWCVAMTAGEAMEHLGVDSYDYKTVEEYLEDMGPLTCEPLEWNQEITVKNLDDGTSKTAQCREWALEQRGVFCSTAW